MTWRSGRRNGHTIYEQQGDAPSDDDRFVGSTVTENDAARLIEAANCDTPCRCDCHKENPR